MKKTFQKLFTIFFLLLISSTVAQAEQIFSDISDSQQNFQAIKALKDQNIIRGYPDGSFRPDNSITRAELLKIVLAGNQISLNQQSPANFPDVQNHWAKDYISKASAEGWIKGYSDGTFKPDQNISRIEALKIIGEVENWQLPSGVTSSKFRDLDRQPWAVPYIIYAEQQNLLFTDKILFFPDKEITRAELSETLYRSINSTLPESTSTESIATFENISLDEKLPNFFYKDEVYYLNGSTNKPESKTIKIILQDISNQSSETFSGQLNAKNHFSIPVYFHKTGNYLIGVIIGEEGSSKAQKISVSSTIPDIGKNKISNLNIKYENGETFLVYKNNESENVSFTFTQNENSVRYFNRQKLEKIKIRYKDFSDFHEANVQITSNNLNLDFMATKHNFSIISDSEIKTSIPETGKKNETINFTATALETLSSTGYITNPMGEVKEINLNNEADTISKNTKFTFSFTPDKEGPYIVEINNKENIAAVNTPIYIGKIIPLIPDYFDINEREFVTDNSGTSKQRAKLLNLINTERAKYNLNPVSLSDDLNTLAQNQSDDMALNNYFSHVNLNGEGPNDRRLKLGIKTAVSENLAQDVSIEFAHEGLMRSGGHRANILNPEHTKVGVGISKKNNYLIIAEEFSNKLPNETELDNFKEELILNINEIRANSNIAELERSSQLEQASSYVNNEIINSKSEIDSSILDDVIKNYNIIGKILAIGRSHNSWQKISNSIINSEDSSEIFNSEYKKIGLSLNLDSEGIMHLLIFTGTK